MHRDFPAGIPLDPFALLEGEHLRRPEIVRYLTFDQMFPRSYRYTASSFARTIVPIELAQPGDQQVIAHRMAGEFNHTPLSIDSLTELPEVVSIVTDRPLTARRPLPHIRELFVVNDFAYIDQETLSNLPGLVSLSLGPGWIFHELKSGQPDAQGHSSPKIDLGVLLGMSGLRNLRFSAFTADFTQSPRFPASLERLRVDGYAPGCSAALLSELSSLRWLALEYWKGLSQLKSLVGLEHLELMGASLASLKPFQGMQKLRSLALAGGGVKSLEGIQALESLEELFLGGVAIHDLAPLAGLSRLHSLRLVGLDKTAHFQPLSQLKNLRSLEIVMGSISSIDRLDSIDFVHGLKHLQTLSIRGALIEDGKLDPLFDLPEIMQVRLLGDYGHQVEKLQRLRPGCDVEVIPLAPEQDGSTIQVGALQIHHQEENLWSVIQDLTGLLGVEDNFAADRKIRRAIRQQAPELFHRLEFDPDADFVSIIARDETDIRQAAGMLASIIEDVARRSAPP
jgi:hypothetical protein